MAGLQYRVRGEGILSTNWQWRDVRGENAYFSSTDITKVGGHYDIEVRPAPDFVPGYYRDNTDGEVVYHTEEPNLRYWSRVKVTDDETGDEYTSAE